MKLGKSVQSLKIMGFYSSGEPEIKEPLDVRLPTSLHTAFGFFLLLDECWCHNWDIGIEWIWLLSLKHAVLQIPPETHLPCNLQWFWITLLDVPMFPYSLLRGKTLLVLRWVTCQLAPCFATAWSWQQKGLILRTSQIHRKLAKISAMIFFRNGDQKNQEIYKGETILEASCTANQHNIAYNIT